MTQKQQQTPKSETRSTAVLSALLIHIALSRPSPFGYIERREGSICSPNDPGTVTVEMGQKEVEGDRALGRNDSYGQTASVAIFHRMISFCQILRLGEWQEEEEDGLEKVRPAAIRRSYGETSHLHSIYCPRNRWIGSKGKERFSICSQLLSHPSRQR